MREEKMQNLNDITKESKKPVENLRAKRPSKSGIVINAGKMNKTIIVSVVSSYRHPLYKKIVKKTTKFKAHDENNEADIGDIVEIMETRHLSKDKYFRLVRIVEKAK